ncbi:hypothetical protein E0H76_37545 [Rhizobium leguminosarum bv. viciae]|nr:hypothetical protein E0H76_37545 [Rhizobium leguminosarum bv. viciae]
MVTESGDDPAAGHEWPAHLERRRRCPWHDLMWWTASAPGIAMCQSVAVESHIRENRPWRILPQLVWISPSMYFKFTE